ncbi:hypothetical protein FGE05_04320 [Pseudomonas sp. ICMP22404]|nr:hypothetical protein FGE05_04320 [Pseudomonas sp. ICMP22404]
MFSSIDGRPAPFPVGASLLAIAVGQSAWMSTDTPSSRAGSLPHSWRLMWERSEGYFAENFNTMVWV